MASATETSRLALLRGPLAVAAAGMAGLGLLAAVDVSQTAILPPCPFLAVTGLWCPFCGGTRALDALVAGDVSAALGLNLLVVLAVPVLAADWARWTTRRARGRPYTPLNLSSRVLLVVASAAVLYTVLRNLQGLEMLAPPQ